MLGAMLLAACGLMSSASGQVELVGAAPCGLASDPGEFAVVFPEGTPAVLDTAMLRHTDGTCEAVSCTLAGSYHCDDLWWVTLWNCPVPPAVGEVVMAVWE